MLLEKLPLELVQHIIGLIISENDYSDHSKALTALLTVNKVLGSEISSLCLRNVQDARHGIGWWPRVPFLARLRMAHELIATKPMHGEKRTIANYMHSVAYYLQQYAIFHDAEETGRLSHMQWLHEIASVLALRGADCRCRKPAFMHSRCYDLSSVPDTAFHVVLLRQHRKLESMMILEEGKGIDSTCPYLKVSEKDPFFTRRNALEWACARGLAGSVVYLLAMAEEQGRNPKSYLPTAAAVSAMHTKNDRGALLKSLLDNLDEAERNPPLQYALLQYCGRTVGFREWISKVIQSLAQHRCFGGIAVLRRHYPYYEGESILRILPKNVQWEPIKAFMESERLYCNFERWGESENHKHWISCRKDWCCNQFSKANPWCVICKCHHREQAVYQNCGQHHPPDRHLYDWRGWPRKR